MSKTNISPEEFIKKNEEMGPAKKISMPLSFQERLHGPKAEEAVLATEEKEEQVEATVNQLSNSQENAEESIKETISDNNESNVVVNKTEKEELVKASKDTNKKTSKTTLSKNKQTLKNMSESYDGTMTSVCINKALKELIMTYKRVNHSANLSEVINDALIDLFAKEEIFENPVIQASIAYYSDNAENK